MAGINNSNEPNTAPQADLWYNLTLGSSFKDQNPSRFCTFRYEFKPASIDKNQRGTLHKSKDNKVTVEFQNIQHGKPKVVFEGSSEDYKDNDAVLFFDGESFRLERLHRAVKRLRHNRALSESAGTASAPVGHADATSPPIGKGTKHQPMNKDSFPALPVEVERIEIGDFRNSDAKTRQEKAVEYPPAQATNPSPDPNNEYHDELLDIMNADDDEDEDGIAAADGGGTIELKELNFDINEPHPNYSEDEIADVDVSNDEADKGPNAAEALRAQVAEERDGRSSSSTGSSATESSGSDSSGSSSSDSDTSDADGDGDSVSV